MHGSSPRRPTAAGRPLSTMSKILQLALALVPLEGTGKAMAQDAQDPGPLVLRDRFFPKSNRISQRDPPSLPRPPLPKGLGGAGRDRTGDLKLAKLALSQLSYGPGWQGDPTRRAQSPRARAPGLSWFRKGYQDGDPPGHQGRRIGSCLRRRQQAAGILRKEVIQPQVPLRLPCYDFTPVADLTVAGCLLAVGAPSSGQTNSHGVTGGVYKARERIHRGVLIHDY